MKPYAHFIGLNDETLMSHFLSEKVHSMPCPIIHYNMEMAARSNWHLDR